MLGRVCRFFIPVLIFCTNAPARTPWMALYPHAVPHYGLVGQAYIPNGSIGIHHSHQNLVGSHSGTNVLPEEKVISGIGLTPSQLIYIIQSTQIDNILGSGTLIPYTPVWYIPY